MKGSSLAELLKEKRIVANLSQWEVAKKLGYTTPQFVSNWERGVSTPPVQVLNNIADLYGTSSDELFEALLFATIQKIKKELRRKFNMVRR